MLEDLPVQSGIEETFGEEETGESYREDREFFIRKAFETAPQQGLELLFREYYGPLCSHAARFVCSAEQARDLVSEVFCNFFQKELYRRVTTSYRAYLYRCVRNDALKYLERDAGKRTVLEAGLLCGPDDVMTPEGLMRFDELSRTVERAIERMPPQSRRIFLMNRYEGKKYREIADELRITLKTVEAHMSKALLLMRQALQPDWLLVLFLAYLG